MDPTGGRGLGVALQWQLEAVLEHRFHIPIGPRGAGQRPRARSFDLLDVDGGLRTDRPASVDHPGRT
jgi:hypothetical protein